MVEDNGWGEYRQRVFYQIETLTRQMGDVQEQLNQLHIDVVVLKLKAAIYGGIASVVIGSAFQVFLYFLKKL